MSNQRTKPATLEDIARIAGVHRKTVGAALQGTGRMSSSTRENVRRIAQELQYEPNLFARALVTGKTGRISVLIGSLDEPYNVLVVQHLVRSLTQNSYEAVIIQAPAHIPSIQTLRGSFSDGMIIVGMQFIDTSASTNVALRGGNGEPTFPCVVIDAGRPPYMDHITLDIGPAVEKALHVLLDSGRKRIAYVNKHSLDSRDQEIRYRWYMNIITKANYKPETIIADELLTNDERVEQLKTYFQQYGAPEAIFCHNDQLAMFTYQALHDLGYDVPEDTLLVGCDGVDDTKYFAPPLSTITMPWKEVSDTACQFLRQRINEPSIPLQEHIVKGQLVVRKSLG